MKLSNGRGFKINLFRRCIVALKGLFGIGVTFGEVAEANGEGPCGRCVGHSVSGPPAGP